MSWKNRNDLFTGGVLRADALPYRFDEHGWSEDTQSDITLTYGGVSKSDESKMMNALYILKSRGLSPRADESIEEFINNNQHQLGDDYESDNRRSV